MTTMLPWWVITLTGLAGGLVNALLLHEGILWLPRRAVNTSTGGLGFDLGFVGNMIVGATAAWLAFTANIGSLAPLQQALLAFGSAVGGAAFLNGFLQQRHIGVLRAEVSALRGSARRIRQKKSGRR